MKPPDRSLVYRVSRNGHVMAECDIDRIVELLDAGEFLWTDLCWAQGMSSWKPLSNLGQEIKAAKAFPPATGNPVRAASSRQRTPAPPISVPKGGVARAYPGWWWVAAGVSVGALVGLLTTRFFPEVVLVDRPVEKVVEKVVERPIEVIRTVEKRVEVPAELTESQLNALEHAKEREDAFKRQVGFGSSSMVPVLGKKVKIHVTVDTVLQRFVTKESVRASVEDVFRRNGFEPVNPDDKSILCNTLINAEIFRANQESSTQVAGVIRLNVAQFLLAEGADVLKIAWFEVKRYEAAVMYGSSSFHKLGKRFEDFAVQAAGDLSKAGKLPYRSVDK